MVPHTTMFYDNTRQVFLDERSSEILSILRFLFSGKFNLRYFEKTLPWTLEVNVNSLISLLLQ